jgi:hypothetical protein
MEPCARWSELSGDRSAAAGAPSGRGTARLRSALSARSLWDGAAAPRTAGRREIAKLADAERAGAGGAGGGARAVRAPCRAARTRTSDHVKLVEKVAIAESFLEREAAAMRWFDLLLALDSRPLSSATDRAEGDPARSRRRAWRRARRPAPEVQVSWPLRPRVSAPGADRRRGGRRPEALPGPRDPVRAPARRARASRRSTSRCRRAAVHESIRLPALATGKPEVMQVYLSAFDRRGQRGPALGLVRAPARDRARLDPRDPLVQQWWVWAASAALVAVATGIAVFVATDEPPDSGRRRLLLLVERSALGGGAAVRRRGCARCARWPC